MKREMLLTVSAEMLPATSCLFATTRMGAFNHAGDAITSAKASIDAEIFSCGLEQSIT